MIRRQLPKDIYSRCVTFLYGTTAEVNRFMRRVYPNDWQDIGVQCEGHWTVREREGYQSDFIIIIQKPRAGSKRWTGNRLRAILAHETLHCASHILRHAGIEHTQATEEAYTYYQQMLFEACAWHLP